MPAQSLRVCRKKRMGLLAALASLRLTLVAMMLLALCIVLRYRLDWISSDWFALALVLLALNLLAAIWQRPQFRRQRGLLVFHFGLLVITVLAGLAILTRMQGRIELVEGQAFDPAQVMIDSRGWWQFDDLDSVQFVQGPVSVEYHPGLRRGATRSEIILGPNPQHLIVGDTQPLRLQGYRFVSTSNKGYAVLLDWIDNSGAVLSGAVHMPSYPLQDWNQVNRWNSPGGETLQLELELPPLQSDRDWVLRTPPEVLPLRLQRGSGADHVLLPEDTITLNGGRLRYRGVRLWLGYQIDYNPLLPWMFAAAMVGIAGLGWHFWTKYGLRSNRAMPALTPPSTQLQTDTADASGGHRSW